MVWLCICIGAQSSTAQSPQQPFLGVTPDSLLLTDQAPAASITLTNLMDTVRQVWIVPECPARDYAMMNGQWFYWWLNPLDPLTAAWRNESQCAAVWLTGYPRHLTLAPRERRTFPVQIAPPATLLDGRYTARMIWVIEEKNSIVHYEIAVTYIKGRSPRRRWRSAPPAGPGSALVVGTPAAVVLTDSAPATTFTLRNRSANPTEVWLYADCPWFIVNFASFPLSSQYESAWHGRIPDAALWLGGFPQHLTLAPHEQRTIPLQLSPGLGRGPGDYYARVVYAEAPLQLGVEGGDTLYTTPAGAVNVVYRWGRGSGTASAQPTLAVSQLQALGEARDTMRTACVTLTQQGEGLAFVAHLHVELDDARGRLLDSNRSPTRWAGEGGTGPWGGPWPRALGDPTWTRDTIVAVWQAVHHPVLDIDTDGERAPATPICFLISRLAPGQYRLKASAYALEDVAQRHAVERTVPLTVASPQ